jgi:serine O-acetyltransferase
MSDVVARLYGLATTLAVPQWPKDGSSTGELTRKGLTLSATRRFRCVRMAVSSVRLIPHLIIMSAAQSSGIIRADLSRWAEINSMNRPDRLLDFILLFVEFMTFTPEFRNLFYLRSGIKGKLFSWMCPPLSSLEIVPGKIGPGLFIQHGVATLVSAESIGANCWINQHVAIGFVNNDTDRPIIGDNVRISAGAKVLGKVRIGNNATIGPNTVVIADVAGGATVLGVPGRVVSVDSDSRVRRVEFAPVAASPPYAESRGQ